MRKEDLEKENKQLRDEVAQLKALARFRDLDASVRVDASIGVDPDQRANVMAYHARRWAQLDAMPAGQPRKEAAVAFARLVKSALESRVIAADEANDWLDRCAAELQA